MGKPRTASKTTIHQAASTILSHWTGLSSAESVRHTFEGSRIRLAPDAHSLADPESFTPDDWNHLFERAYLANGAAWLAAVEPLARTLCSELSLPVPMIFGNALATAESSLVALQRRHDGLEAAYEARETEIRQFQDRIIRCPLTGLFSDSYFRQFMLDTLTKAPDTVHSASLLFIAVDNMVAINQRYGDSVGDEAIKACSYVIRSALTGTCELFRLQAATFALFVPTTTRSRAVDLAEDIRKTVNSSTFFLERLSVSIGVVEIGDFAPQQNITEQPEARYAEAWFDRIKAAGRIRLLNAQRQGANSVCTSSSTQDRNAGKPLVVCADTELLTLEILQAALESGGYRVVCCQDGNELLATINRATPQFIICELMLPKMDGFTVRSQLNEKSGLGQIPFMLLSRKKDDASVDRSIDLGIEYYLKKPFFLNEILGIVNRRCRNVPA